ncbi:MAG: phosphoserine transaminase [Actinomycetaceae bacterium]|nr:phosphoserine transaminase [Actinomycetaceae bacterium]
MRTTIPAHLLPADGRFGSGPSKVRPEQLARVADAASPMGTSHRQAPVKSLVGQIRAQLAELFHLPDGYEIMLGNGGASLVWDAIAFTAVESRAQAAVFGEFSTKAARAVGRVPWAEVDIQSAEPGRLARCVDRSEEDDAVDTYLYPQNETSTGVLSPVTRYGRGSGSHQHPGALTLVDATSSAGGVTVDITQTDLYYFSPQKCFGADGGLWIAVASPAAIERIERLGSTRWVPDILNLELALHNSRKDQTLNTPSVANLLLIAEQTEWMLSSGGLDAMAERTATSSALIYDWAEKRPEATPFVANAAHRSPVVATIDFDESVDTRAISALLRENGIVDIDPYRSLGRNQFRFGTFPNVEPDDVAALLACIDWAIEHM